MKFDYIQKWFVIKTDLRIYEADKMSEFVKIRQFSKKTNHDIFSLFLRLGNSRATDMGYSI